MPAKQIIFTFEGKDYTLEFTRRSVKRMEDAGFVADQIGEKPMTMLPTLFAGAFLAHHPFVKQEVIDRIYAAMPNKSELVGKLADMYNEPIAALMDDPEESSEKVDWVASW